MATRLLSTQKIVNLPSDPATGTAGEIYFNTTSNVFKFHNGTAWQNLVGDIDSLTDVVIDSPVTGQVLTYDSATDKWKNLNPTGGGGGGGTSESNMAYTFWFGV